MCNSFLSQYETFVFDCDGVILNSNQIKTQAFYNVAKVYGHTAAQELRDYHIENGGISRYKKFQHLFVNILHREASDQEYSRLLESFSKEVKNFLLSCEVAKDIEILREKTKNSKWLIVSGGDESELREVFCRRKLDHLFDNGIFGSPKDKDMIIKNKKEEMVISGKSLFLGDSMYDYSVAKRADMDFIFITEWTEVHHWKQWCQKSQINSILNLSGLMDEF